MSTATIHLDRLLEPLAGCLSPDVAAKVADLRADETMQNVLTIWPSALTTAC